MDLPVPDDSLYELHRYAAMWDTDTPNDEGSAVRLVAAPVLVRELRRLAGLCNCEADAVMLREHAADVLATIPPAEVGGEHKPRR